MARNSSQTRIIESASLLFHQYGFDVVTVDQICHDSSSAKGSFYHFFSSKEDLAVKLLDNLWESNELALEKTFSKDKPPLEQIRDELHRVYSQARASREKTGQINGCAMGVLASSLSSRSEKIRKRASFLYNHTRQFYLASFEQAQSEGDLRADFDASELADTMLVIVQGIHAMGRTFNSPTKVKRLVNSAFSVLVGNN